MEWLSQNWVWVLFIGAFIAMHLFGHGGHGGHGGHAGHGETGGDRDNRSSTGKDVKPRPAERPQGHQH